MNTTALCVVALCVSAGVASGQSLERRVADAKGSVVGFEYGTRPNVCGDGSSISISDDSSAGWNERSRRRGIHIGSHGSNSGRDWYERCDTGPARVLIRRYDSGDPDVRVTVGGRPDKADTELGEVSPADAAAYLLDLAPRLGGKSAEHAVMGAEIARGVVAWPRLLQIARANGASPPAARAAVFWLSQEATVAATAGLDSISGDDTISLSVRKDALFFLSQRPGGEGIPALVRVAEGSQSIALRKDAIFFLAQSRDKRALDLFERLLTGR